MPTPMFSVACPSRPLRVNVFDGPDRLGRYHFETEWWTNYSPGHAEGEFVPRWRGQNSHGVLPRWVVRMAEGDAAGAAAAERSHRLPQSGIVLVSMPGVTCIDCGSDWPIVEDSDGALRCSFCVQEREWAAAEIPGWAPLLAA